MIHIREPRIPHLSRRRQRRRIIPVIIPRLLLLLLLLWLQRRAERRRRRINDLIQDLGQPRLHLPAELGAVAATARHPAQT